MSVLLTLHSTPGYDSENPLSNANLYFQDTEGNIISSDIQLDPAKTYSVHATVKNEGTSTENRGFVAFFYSEAKNSSLSEATQLGTVISKRIEAEETLVFTANSAFTPVEGKSYEFYAITTSSIDPAPDYTTQPIDATNRHVAGQSIAIAGLDKNVLLTLHDGVDIKHHSNYKGHNPNIYLEGPDGTIYDSPAGKQIGIERGVKYTLKARVVNQGKDATPCKVYFFEHASGLNQNLKNPIAVSEENIIEGNNGEFIYSSTTTYEYNHHQNAYCLVAVCTSPDDEVKGIETNASISGSDRHVAQHNIHVDGSITTVDRAIIKKLYIPELVGHSFTIKRLAADEHLHENIKSKTEAPELDDLIVNGKSLKSDIDMISEGITINAKDMMNKTIDIEFKFSQKTKRNDVSVYAAFAAEGGVQYVFDFAEILEPELA